MLFDALRYAGAGVRVQQATMASDVPLDIAGIHSVRRGSAELCGIRAVLVKLLFRSVEHAHHATGWWWWCLCYMGCGLMHPFITTAMPTDGLELAANMAHCITVLLELLMPDDALPGGWSLAVWNHNNRDLWSLPPLFPNLSYHHS